MLRVLLRAAPWRALLVMTATGAATGTLALVLPVGTGARVLQMALVVTGAASACALEEPAAAVVSSCPVRRTTQLLVRAAAATVPLLVAVALALAWWVVHSVERSMLLQLGGTWALGLALAVVARRWLDEPGEVVAPALVLVLYALMNIDAVGRHLALFPLGGATPRTVHVWWLLIGTASVVLVAAVREKRWR